MLLLALASSPLVSQSPAAEEVVPGAVVEEIVLSAGDASGWHVALAVAADLRRTPLRHSVRVVRFEKTGLHTSEAWLRSLGTERRSRILAHLDLERLGWRQSAGPVLHLLAAEAGAGERVFTPGWLVHALLRSGEAVGWPYAVTDHRFPLLGQLLVRAAEVRLGSDGETFLRHGIPAVTLSARPVLSAGPAMAAGRPDPRRLERWTEAVAAAVRRLDALAGRPVPEDQYLAACGRVWLRRDLIWIGFLLWALLVFRGLPGRWRGTPAVERRRQTRTYFPGFLLRLLLLLAIFLAPVFSVLLWPAALLALAPPRRTWARFLWIVLGLLPLLAFLGTLGYDAARRVLSLEAGLQTGGAAAVLIPAVLAAFALSVASPRPR